MNQKISTIIHLVVPLFILHMIEEVTTHFYETDSSTQSASQYLHLTPEATYFLIQIALFAFLSILLFSILKLKKINIILVLILDVILLYEITHVFEAVKSRTYSSGVITGTILFVIGLLLIYTLLNTRNTEVANKQ